MMFSQGVSHRTPRAHRDGTVVRVHVHMLVADRTASTGWRTFCRYGLAREDTSGDTTNMTLCSTCEDLTADPAVAANVAWAAQRLGSTPAQLAAERRRERRQSFHELFTELREHCGLSDCAIATYLSLSNASLLRQLNRHGIQPTREFVRICCEEATARRRVTPSPAFSAATMESRHETEVQHAPSPS